MRRLFVVALLGANAILARPVNAQGQDRAPAVEVFIGGAKLWQHSMGGPEHNHGPELAITGNFNRFLGLEMSVSRFQDSPPTAPAFADYYRLLFGPHFAYNGNSHVSPFAHFLVGVTGGRQCPPTSPCNLGSEEVPGTAFTDAMGGGVDVKVFRFFWIRPIQADYVHVFFHNAPENNLQLSFGFTLRFGSVKQK